MKEVFLVSAKLFLLLAQLKGKRAVSGLLFLKPASWRNRQSLEEKIRQDMYSKLQVAGI